MLMCSLPAEGQTTFAQPHHQPSDQRVANRQSSSTDRGMTAHALSVSLSNIEPSTVRPQASSAWIVLDNNTKAMSRYKLNEQAHAEPSLTNFQILSHSACSHCGTMVDWTCLPQEGPKSMKLCTVLKAEERFHIIHSTKACWFGFHIDMKWDPPGRKFALALSTERNKVFFTCTSCSALTYGGELLEINVYANQKQSKSYRKQRHTSIDNSVADSDQALYCGLCNPGARNGKGLVPGSY